MKSGRLPRPGEGFPVGGSAGVGVGSAISSSSASRAARTIKPLLCVVRVLQCLAMAAVVHVVGTVACFYQLQHHQQQQQQQAEEEQQGVGNPLRNHGLGRGPALLFRDDESLHAFGGRPVLCAFVLLVATALGLALRARPRFRKILELHHKRSLVVRAVFIAAIMLLEVHALRRLGATGVVLAEVSLQYLVLPTLAVILLSQVGACGGWVGGAGA
jgi:hypothetical protein